MVIGVLNVLIITEVQSSFCFFSCLENHSNYDKMLRLLYCCSEVPPEGFCREGYLQVRLRYLYQQ